MSRILNVCFMGVVMLGLAGCGAQTKELGPATPESTPKPDPEMMKREMQKMYEKGGRGGPRTEAPPPGVTPPGGN